MHPRIAELLDYLDTQFESVRDAYHSVPEDRRDARPAADAWSPMLARAASATSRMRRPFCDRSTWSPCSIAVRS
jgi:hypothetical protein